MYEKGQAVSTLCDASDEKIMPTDLFGQTAAAKLELVKSTLPKYGGVFALSP